MININEYLINKNTAEKKFTGIDVNDPDKYIVLNMFFRTNESIYNANPYCVYLSLVRELKNVFMNDNEIYVKTSNASKFETFYFNEEHTEYYYKAFDNHNETNRKSLQLLYEKTNLKRILDKSTNIKFFLQRLIEYDLIVNNKQPFDFNRDIMNYL